MKRTRRNAETGTRTLVTVFPFSISEGAIHMTANSKPSKNSRRKRQRATYHEAVNALSRNPNDACAMEILNGLMEKYCRTVDKRIDGIGAFSEDQSHRDEQVFIRDLLRQVGENGWVTIHTPQGVIQLKADINDYVTQRRAGDSRFAQVHAVAAEYLHERAISVIRPRHK